MRALARRLAAVEAKLMPKQRTVLIFLLELGPAPEPQNLQPGERGVRDYQEAAAGFITFQHRATRDAEDTGRYSCCEDGVLEQYLLKEYAGQSLPVRVADAFADKG
jgi:hypothetical protein